MGRLSWLIAILIAVLSIASTLLVNLSRRSPTTLLSTVFTDPDGAPCQMPCLLGVRPGFTLYRDAIAILRVHPLTRAHRFDSQRGNLYGAETIILVYSTMHGPVSRIDLVHRSNRAAMAWGSLGEVIFKLSAPDVVRVDADFTTTYFLASRIAFIHSHNALDAIGPDEGLERIEVYARSLQIQPNAAAWHGFGSAGRYLPERSLLRIGVRQRTPDNCTRKRCRTE